MIRTALFLGSVCMTAWQLPALMDRIDALGIGGPLGLPSAATAAHQPEPAPVSPDEIILFSPDGKQLTAAEVAALKKLAAAQAPINTVRTQPPTETAPASQPGAPVQIGAPNPSVEELLKRIQELQAKDGGGSR